MEPLTQHKSFIQKLLVCEVPPSLKQARKPAVKGTVQPPWGKPSWWAVRMGGDGETSPKAPFCILKSGEKGWGEAWDKCEARNQRCPDTGLGDGGVRLAQLPPREACSGPCCPLLAAATAAFSLQIQTTVCPCPVSVPVLLPRSQNSGTSTWECPSVSGCMDVEVGLSHLVIHSLSWRRPET